MDLSIQLFGKCLSIYQSTFAEHPLGIQLIRKLLQKEPLLIQKLEAQKLEVKHNNFHLESPDERQKIDFYTMDRLK